MTMQLKTYHKMCKHHGNDEGCDAAMDAMRDLLYQSGVLPIAMVVGTWNRLSNCSSVYVKANRKISMIFPLVSCCSCVNNPSSS